VKVSICSSTLPGIVFTTETTVVNSNVAQRGGDLVESTHSI
jgi:hypothetical protein